MHFITLLIIVLFYYAALSTKIYSVFFFKKKEKKKNGLGVVSANLVHNFVASNCLLKTGINGKRIKHLIPLLAGGSHVRKVRM